MSDIMRMREGEMKETIYQGKIFVFNLFVRFQEIGGKLESILELPLKGKGNDSELNGLH